MIATVTGTSFIIHTHAHYKGHMAVGAKGSWKAGKLSSPIDRRDRRTKRQSVR